MKHLFTFLFLLSSILAFSQTTYSVCNRPGFDADFTDLQTAVNTVPSGSILLVQGSPTSYGSITITKPLTLSGPGYFLDQNPQTQAAPNQFVAQFGQITLDNGANNCLIEGLYGSTIILDSVSNPIIQSCFLSSYNIITLNYVSNLQVKKCYISSPYNPFTDNIGNSTSVITNNLIFFDCYGCVFHNSIIENNYFFNNCGTQVASYNSTIQNNIFNVPYLTGSNNAILNNLFSGASPVGATNGNQENVNMNTVFVGGSSPDAQYQLKIGSPAIGAGLGGVDCGAFGGSSPYILSGMSYNPNIWDVTMPASGTSNGGLNITVKANANQ